MELHTQKHTGTDTLTHASAQMHIHTHVVGSIGCVVDVSLVANIAADNYYDMMCAKGTAVHKISYMLALI